MKKRILLMILIAIGLTISSQAQTKIGFYTLDDFDISGNSVAHYGMSSIRVGSDHYVGLSGYFGLNFYTNGTERIKVLRDGKVGIGTSTPSYLLDVSGDVRINENKYLRFGANQWAIQQIGGNLNFLEVGKSDGVLFMKSGGNLGIGTTNPLEKLHIKSNDSSSESTLLRLDNSGTNGSVSGMEFYSSPADSQSSNRVGRISGKFDGGSFVDARLSFYSMTVGNVLVETLSLKNGKVGIGTTNPGSWKLAVNGNIRAKEIKVETGWSDFVFYDDYKLPTLEEVENHIKEKGHLKDIPSAKEVEKDGIFLGEMDSKLLQKIEELTLYTIDQEKKIKALEKQKIKLEKQQKEIDELKTLVNKLLNKKK